MKKHLLLGLLILGLAGCATTQNQPLISQLQLRVGELERQLGPIKEMFDPRQAITVAYGDECES